MQRPFGKLAVMRHLPVHVRRMVLSIFHGG